MTKAQKQRYNIIFTVLEGCVIVFVPVIVILASSGVLTHAQWPQNASQVVGSGFFQKEPMYDLAHVNMSDVSDGSAGGILDTLVSEAKAATAADTPAGAIDFIGPQTHQPTEQVDISQITRVRSLLQELTIYDEL